MKLTGEPPSGAICVIARKAPARMMTMTDISASQPISAMAPFDLVFCDPPYRKGLGEKALASAREGGWLAKDALVLFEEAAGAEIALLEGFEELDRRDYGETQVRFLKAV